MNKLSPQARRLAQANDITSWLVLADMLEEQGHADALLWRLRHEAATLLSEIRLYVQGESVVRVFPLWHASVKRYTDVVWLTAMVAHELAIHLHPWHSTIARMTKRYRNKKAAEIADSVHAGLKRQGRLP